MVKDSFLNWGFKPSINTDVFTEGGYKWGGNDTGFNLSLYFEMDDSLGLNYIPDENYNRPQGYWYSIGVYLLAEGLISHRKKDHEFPIDRILISDAMIEDWVEDSWEVSQRTIDRYELEPDWIEATPKLDIFWDTDSYDSATLKRMIFDNMDKVLIESRGDFQE